MVVALPVVGGIDGRVGDGVVVGERVLCADGGGIGALGLGSGERLVVKDVITDADGSANVRYNRTFNGLRVIGGDLVSHRDKAGEIKNVNWNSSRKVAVASTTPKLSLASAKVAGP